MKPFKTGELTEWIAACPVAALTASARAAIRQIPGELGVRVAALLEDHSIDPVPDPNIHELAYVLLHAEVHGGHEG